MDENRLLRMKAVAVLLGISRHTLRRVMNRDPTFPKFIELAPGIRMVRAREVLSWLRRKELAAYEKTAPGAPTAPRRAD